MTSGRKKMDGSFNRELNRDKIPAYNVNLSPEVVLQHGGTFNGAIVWKLCTYL